MSEQSKSEPPSEIQKIHAEMHRVLDNVGALISYIGPDQKYRRVNRAYTDWFGIEVNEVVGRTIGDFIGEPHVSRAAPYIREVLQGRSVTFESEAPHKDGTVRQTSVSYTPDRGPDGEVQGFIALVQDITERKRHENERAQLLKASECREAQLAEANAALLRVNTELEQTRGQLGDLFESMTDAFFALDRDWCFTYMNRQAERLLFRTRGELLGKNVWEEFPAAVNTKFDHNYRRAMVERVVTEFEEFYLPLSTWFEVRAYPSADGLGIYFHDISSRKRSEEQIRQATETMERQWHIFDTALSSTVDFIYTIDLECRFTYANQALLSLWRKSFDEIVGKRFFELDYSQELAATLEQQLQQVVSTRQPLRAETPYTDVVGSTRYYEYIFVPVFGDDGAVYAVAGSTRDITERQEAEERLVRSNESLRKANQELEEFAYVASHDLQEPLRMVNIYTELLLGRFSENQDPQTAEFSNHIHAGVQRMELLLRDLLSYSRTIQQDEQKPVLMDLQRSLDRALTVLQARIEEEQATISVARLPWAMGDEGQLVHVFQNLISNALKYSKHGEPARIAIASARAGEEWIVSVRDEGVGFSPRHAERIFGLFKRLHGDSHPGTGLGLAICKRIVERYGGRIWAEWQIDQGSTFYFSLKAAKE